MKLQELLMELGFKPRSYSGRGMCGKQCVGVTIDRCDLPWLIADLSENGGGKYARFVNTDDMGLSIIAYWPTVPWTDTPPAGRS